MFTRSLSPFKRQGIRINVLCPEVSLSFNAAHERKRESEKKILVQREYLIETLFNFLYAVC